MADSDMIRASVEATGVWCVVGSSRAEPAQLEPIGGDWNTQTLARSRVRRYIPENELENEILLGVSVAAFAVWVVICVWRSGQPDPNARTFQLSTRPDLLFHTGGDLFYISIALSVCSYLVPHVDPSRMTAFIYVIGRSDTRLLDLTTMTSTQWQHPKLPSVLPAVPAVQDVTTTAEQVNSGMARITNPTETPIFICALDNCYRLFSSRDRVMTHRKRDHDTEDQEEIITWNE